MMCGSACEKGTNLLNKLFLLEAFGGRDEDAPYVNEVLPI